VHQLALKAKPDDQRSGKLPDTPSKGVNGRLSGEPTPSKMPRLSGILRMAANAPKIVRGFTAEELKKRERNNYFIGSTIMFLVGGVYMYSMTAVKQEDFSDVEAAATMESPSAFPKL